MLKPAASLLALVALALSGVAWAQDRPTLNGTWSAGAMTENWAIGDWGEACGPKPAPQTAGAGTVEVREQGGELSMVGAGRAWNTSECWEQMPGLARTSHSQSGGGRFWRTRCSSAPNDPRRATIITTVQATDTSISVQETGQYQFVIHDTNCTASVTRARRLTLMHREGEAAPATPSAAPTAAPAASAPAANANAPAPTPAPKRCTGAGGDPARLEVRPTRKLLHPGERFAFRALVLDADGCAVATRPTWAIAQGPLATKASVDPSGEVAIADDAPDGTVEVKATVGGKEGVSVTVEVASADRYDALLASGALNDAGESEQTAVAVIATGTLGGERGVARDVAKGRRYAFVAIVVGLAAFLGLAAFALLRRGRAERGTDDDEAATGTMSSFDADSAESAYAASGGVSASGDASTSASEPRGPGASAQAPARPATRGKICPTCGTRYPADAAFCGKDGTTLVLIN